MYSPLHKLHFLLGSLLALLPPIVMLLAETGTGGCLGVSLPKLEGVTLLGWPGGVQGIFITQGHVSQPHHEVGDQILTNTLKSAF